MKTDHFSLIFLVLWAIYMFGIYTPNAFRYKKQANVDNEKSRPIDITLDMLAFLGWQIIPLIYVFDSSLDFANYSRPNWLGWLGALLLVASVFLYWRAYSDLGTNWSPKIETRESQQLVTNGVYKQLRHPVYAAMWLWCAANALLLPNWIAGFAITVTFLPLYVTRVPREEAMMLATFGDDYQAYIERTGRIWPKF